MNIQYFKKEIILAKGWWKEVNGNKKKKMKQQVPKYQQIWGFFGVYMKKESEEQILCHTSSILQGVVSLFHELGAPFRCNILICLHFHVHIMCKHQQNIHLCVPLGCKVHH